MLGKKVPSSKLFYQFSLEARVPADHLLRQVAAAVDLSFVRRMTKRFYSHTGQPGVDPVVLFKMALIGFLYGIVSERRLEEEIDLHLAYRWFIGYDLDEKVPNHSVLAKARRRFGPTVFLGYFKEIVQQCEKAGLIRGDRMFADSTLVEANASKESEVLRVEVLKVPDVEEHVKRLWEENSENESAEEGSPEGGEGNGQGKLVVLHQSGSVESGDASPETAPTGAVSAGAKVEDTGVEETRDLVSAGREAAAPGLSAVPPSVETEEEAGEGREVMAGAAKPSLHVAGPGDQPNKITVPLNALVVNRVDPDAEFVERKGVVGKWYYKVHVAMDRGRERIITAVEVTGGGVADEHLLERLIKEHEGNVGRSVEEVCADTKYGTIANYKRLEELGKKASIPPRSAAEREVARAEFVYDAKSDSFVCPEGKRLGHRGYTANGSGERAILYRAKPKQCAGCAKKEGCCGKAQARTISVPDDGGLRKRTLSYLATPHARDTIRRRKAWIETNFGDGKERRGLRRADCRGLDRMRVQAWMTGIAQNIRQLALRKGKRPVQGVEAMRQPASCGLDLLISFSPCADPAT